MSIRRRIWATIGGCAAAGLVGICNPLQAQGLSHTPSSAVTYADTRVLYSKPSLSWEVFAGPVLSLEPIRDEEEFLVSDYTVGAEAGVRLHLSSALSVSLGGQYFPSPRKQLPLTSRFHSETFYAAMRCYPLKSSIPSLWVEGGAGWTQTAFDVVMSLGEKAKSHGALFFGGVGNAFSLGKGWKLDFSFRLLYRAQTDLVFYYHYHSHVYRQGAVFLSKQF